MAKRQINFSDPEVISQIAHALVDHTPIAYLILDKKLRIHFFNQFYLKIRKLADDSVLGNYCYNLTNNGVPCPDCAVRDTIDTGRTKRVARKDYLPDGSYCHVDDYAIPIADADGNFDYILEVVVDRTTERRVREKNERLYVGMIEALIALMDKKDPYTRNHSLDVTRIAVKLANFIGLPPEEVHDIRLASLLHDIGKIYIPDTIINKPAALTPDEFETIKRHSVETFNMLSHLSQFEGIRQMAGHHHERWDGKGYPDGLSGQEIPLGARILCVADAYDAMTSNRPYRRAISHDDAVTEIEANAGRQFDPVLARRFVEMAGENFGSRERMLKDRARSVFKRRGRTTIKIERRISSGRGNSTRIFHNDMMSFFSNREFMRAVMENSPCFYLIVDKDFNILYSSENFSRQSGLSREEVGAKRCFELAERGAIHCFELEDGKVKCPAVRAFLTGKMQEGKTHFDFRDETVFCDVYAVPVEMRDQNGESFPCVMEIILDRSRETRALLSMESDVKRLLEILMQLTGKMSENITSDSRSIIQSCATFGEYLTRMSERIRTMEERD